ncbi:unnamed protein product [Schistosoma curassoni]|uniref:Reverse transcriptase domain-containing protein n=1 Tax=Schistosoma curassoni TaxID=6186 RepID=A0A183K236_9TREM|nr:unnamed protein product [Schistosoma curassoni]
MKTSTSEGKHGIQWTSRMQLDDLDFAGDLALLSQTQQQMQEKTNSVAVDSGAVGLNIHKGKSRVLRYNTACTNPVTIDGKDLEDVKTFTYLGSIIDEHDFHLKCFMICLDSVMRRHSLSELRDIMLEQYNSNNLITQLLVKGFLYKKTKL